MNSHTHGRGHVLPRTTLSVAGSLLVAATLVGAHPNSAAQSRSEPLYVIDNRDAGQDGRVIAVDAESGVLLREFRASAPMNRPDMALSRDGRRLFVSYSVSSEDGNRSEGILEVFDTDTGVSITRLSNPNRWMSTLPLYTTHMALSADGRWLFQQKMTISGGHAQYFISTFDTEALAFLPRSIPIPECTSAIMLPHPVQSTRLLVMCSHTQDIRDVSIQVDGSNSGASRKADLRQAPRAPHPGTAFISLDGATATALLGDGQFVTTALSSMTVVRSGLIDQARRRATLRPDGRIVEGPAAVDWLAQRHIREQRPIRLGDGSVGVLGLSSSPSTGHGWGFFRELAVIDVAQLQHIQTVSLPAPSWSIAAARDGALVYAVSPDNSAIYVISTSTGTIIKTLQLPTSYPMMVLAG